jgi:hypothetical protein
MIVWRVQVAMGTTPHTGVQRCAFLCRTSLSSSIFVAVRAEEPHQSLHFRFHALVVIVICVRVAFSYVCFACALQCQILQRLYISDLN